MDEKLLRIGIRVICPPPGVHDPVHDIIRNVAQHEGYLSTSLTGGPGCGEEYHIQFDFNENIISLEDAQSAIATAVRSHAWGLES